MGIELSLVRAFLGEEHHELADNAGRWASEVIDALPACHEDGPAREQARKLVRLLGDGGWLQNAIPNTDLRSCVLLREIFAYRSALADSVFALQCLGSMPLVLAGSDALKSKWLPAVLEGRAMAAFAISTGFCSVDDGKNSTPTCSAIVSNCLMAAGR